MTAEKRRAVVVGGGVIGTACASFLLKTGWQVTILDKGGFGQGCSRSNCGLVCPSHILPLAEPGMVREGLRSLLRSNAPFAIRPRFDPALWSWLLAFARRCDRQKMIDAGRGIQALLESSRALYDEIIARESLDCEWQ